VAANGILEWSGSVDEVLEHLQTNAEKGLSPQEAILRQRRDGPNAIKAEEKVSRIRLFFNQFKSPVVITLLVATFISVGVGEIVDAVANFCTINFRRLVMCG
jgi:magnesium-transporting ATPase (P-type)